MSIPYSLCMKFRESLTGLFSLVFRKGHSFIPVIPFNDKSPHMDIFFLRVLYITILPIMRTIHWQIFPVTVLPILEKEQIFTGGFLTSKHQIRILSSFFTRWKYIKLILGFEKLCSNSKQSTDEIEFSGIRFCRTQGWEVFWIEMHLDF